MHEELINFLESLESDNLRAFYGAYGISLTKMAEHLTEEDAEHEDDYQSLIPHSMLMHHKIFKKVFNIDHADFVENPKILTITMFSDGLARLYMNSYSGLAEAYSKGELHLEYDEALRKCNLVNACFVIGVDIIIDAMHRKDIDDLERNIDEAISTDFLRDKLGL